MIPLDISKTVAPRSDQLNAEDLLSGPRTFTISEVHEMASAEQPVSIYLEESDRPFKPSKTVRRILMTAWGTDTDAYIGRRITLYCDPTVKFGGMEVGGIRVSHMSHIEQRFTVALTVTRGKKAPYVIDPLTDAPTSAQRITPDQEQDVRIHMRRLGWDGSRVLLAAMSVTGRTISSARDLTADEADRLLVALEEVPSEVGDAVHDDEMGGAS